MKSTDRNDTSNREMVTISRAEYDAQQGHKKHEYTLDNIPECVAAEQVHHRLEGEDLVCPNCGEAMTEIGTEVVRTLEIIPAKTVVMEHIYHTYACQKCSKEGTETPVVKAPKEKEHYPRQLCHF